MKTWTREEVQALGVRTDLVTACEAALGVGRRKSYELAQRGELPFRAVRVGSRYVVPVAGVLAFLEMGGEATP